MQRTGRSARMGQGAVYTPRNGSQAVAQPHPPIGLARGCGHAEHTTSRRRDAHSEMACEGMLRAVTFALQRSHSRKSLLAQRLMLPNENILHRDAVDLAELCLALRASDCNERRGCTARLVVFCKVALQDCGTALRALNRTERTPLLVSGPRSSDFFCRHRLPEKRATIYALHFGWQWWHSCRFNHFQFHWHLVRGCGCGGLTFCDVRSVRPLWNWL